MMMSLGLFVFGLPTLAYQDLSRRSSWRHGQGSRVGARPASQYLGPGDELVTLSGVLAPEITGDPASLDQLREMADEGDAYPLVTGASPGEVLGAFVIESIDTRGEHFFADGTPSRIEFDLSLRRVDDQAQTSSAYG